MFRLSLRHIWSRKGRLVVTAIAVIAGTAFLNGVFVFTGTITRSFTSMFADAFAGTDAVVRSANVVEGGFGVETRSRIDVELIDVVAEVDGVSEVFGDVNGSAVVSFEGEVLGVDGPPKFGGVWIDSERSPWDLAEGRAPAGPAEVVLDRGSAKFGGVEVGDEVLVTTTGRARPFTVVGVATFAGADSSGGAGWALFDLPTAQDFVIGDTSLIDGVIVGGDGSASQDELAAAIDAAIDDPEIEVLTGEAITDENQSAVEESLGFLTIFLSVFALISLFVGSFIIYNVFSISVAQRTRENAILRAIGASRGQITRSVFTEAFVVGFGGSLIGCISGVGLALTILRVLDALGFGPGETSLVVGVGGFVTTMIVGVTVTLLCAIVPAIRSGRVPPLAAMRDVAVDRSAVSRGRRMLGVVSVIVAAAAVFAGLTGDARWLGVGVGALLVALIALGPFVAAPIARGAAPLLGRLRGAAGTMSGRNAARNPKRTAITASALAVGLSLMIGVATLGASAKASLREVIGDAFTADYVVSSRLQSGVGLPTELADDLDAAGIGRALGLSAATMFLVEPDDAGVPADATKTVIAVDPERAAAVLEIDFVAGSFADLDATGILYSADKAERDGLTVGDTVGAGLIDGQRIDLVVQGVFNDDTFGNLIVDRELFAGQSIPLFDIGVFVRADGGVTEANTAALEAVAAGYPTARLQSRDDYIQEQDDQVDAFLNFIYALLGMSIFIAVIGIVITLWLAVYERRRELGLLRAVGMTKRQVRSSVLWESMITGVVGVVLGVILGIALGWIIVRSFADEGLGRFALPGATIIAAAVMALLFAAVASVVPARRAAKADMLEAIATT